MKKSPISDRELLAWTERYPSVTMQDLVGARVTLSSLMRSPPEGVGLDPDAHRGMIERAAKVAQERRMQFWKVFEAICKGLVDGSN